MNFQTILEELNRLYEEDLNKAEKVTNEADADAKNASTSSDEAPEADETKLTEAVEDDEEVIEIEDDAEEEPAEEQQFVLECTNCGGICIKHEADVKIDEDADLANMEEACQYCEEAAGYKIIGTFVPYETAEEAEEPVEDVEEDEPAFDDEEIVEEGLFGVDLPINVDIEANGNAVPVLNTAV